MRQAGNGRSGWRRGFLGLYALNMMSEGPIYVHQLNTRVAERTLGAWQPSAGAAYPAIRSLVRQGLARSRQTAGRRLYEITAAGRTRLREFHAQRSRWRSRFGESWRLMLDFVEPGEISDHLLHRLRTDWTILREVAEGTEGKLSATERSDLVLELRSELEHELRQISTLGRSRSASRSLSASKPRVAGVMQAGR